MADSTTFSAAVEDLSSSPNIEITLEEDSQTSEQFFENEDNDFGDDCNRMLEKEGGNQMSELGGQDLENDFNPVVPIEGNDHDNYADDMIMIEHDGISPENDYPPPVAGMEFESYDDAYNYYNCYSKELGFAIRVKSSWTKRNSKEKRGAVLCCNCEGFKTLKEAQSRRKDTRTGCQAMIRLRLVESNRWRVDEVKIEHNHSFDPERAQKSKSHKKKDAGAKRKVEPTFDVEVRTIKLYRTPTDHIPTTGNPISNEEEIPNFVDQSKFLKLQQGDAEMIQKFFCRMQQTNPNFVYLIDLTDSGHLRNVFWIDSSSRAAYSYFGDVVALDTSYLSNAYEIPLLAFVGVNHHGRSLLLGCGLIADEQQETYIWLLRAWLTCMSGRPPQTIITGRCKALQGAIAEVFPRAHHRVCFSSIMQSVCKSLGESQESESFQMSLNRIIDHSLKVEEFETAWEDMIQHFGLKDHHLIKTLYEERERWAPVYSKDSFFAGMSAFQQGESMSPFFNGYVHKQTSLKEFFEIYEIALQKQHQKEALDDVESRDFIPLLKSSCYFELQLSTIYTKEVFERFQLEAEMMSCCYSVSQIHVNGSIFTYLVKELVEGGNEGDMRNFEVMHDKAGGEVRCMCSCFNLKGYLCRHALCILNYNGVEEIPPQYILSRWRKDIKRIYVPDIGSNNVDITNPVQWFEHLYRKAMHIVEEGSRSQDHYMVAWQALKESLNKVRLVAGNLANQK